MTDCKAATPLSETLILDTESFVSLEQIVHYSQAGKTVALTDGLISRAEASRAALDRLLEQKNIIYGVNTGLGGFVDYMVPLEKAAELQNNLINAAATNIGGYFDDHIARAAFLARIISLARGNSAISAVNLRKMAAIYNAGLIPCIPEKGSLGASGDLGPLAAIALCLTGRWKARYGNQLYNSAEILAKIGVEPLQLSYKEGLALINGTSAMTALGAITLFNAARLLDKYVAVSALALEGLAAKAKPFDPRVHRLKPHSGQMEIAKRLWDKISGSRMIVNDDALSAEMSADIAEAGTRYSEPIEDAYSIRCTPQILGPVLDTFRFAKNIIETELNSSSDNPLISPENGEVFHNGHFHGQYIAMVMDYVSISITVLCNLSDRRTDRFLTAANSNGLPPFLCKETPGLRLGLMGGQFMSASLTAENRSLAMPVSIQSLTSTADFQDIVSFGLVAARRARDILANAKYIVGFELLCAAQAAQIRGAQQLSAAGAELLAKTRNFVPYLDKDIVLTDYLEILAHHILDGATPLW